MNFTELIGHPTWSLSGFSQKQRFPTKHGSSTVRVKCARSPSRTSAPDHSIPPPSPWTGSNAIRAACGSQTCGWSDSDNSENNTRGGTPHTCDRTHRDMHDSSVLQPAITTPIGLTKPVASEAFVQTKHAALLIKPSTQPEMTSASEHAPAHATEKDKEMRSRAVVVFVGHH